MATLMVVMGCAGPTHWAAHLFSFADASYDAASGNATSVAAFPIAGVGPLEEVTVDPFYLLLAAGLLLAWAARTRRWGVRRW